MKDSERKRGKLKREERERNSWRGEIDQIVTNTVSVIQQVACKECIRACCTHRLGSSA